MMHLLLERVGPQSSAGLDTAGAQTERRNETGPVGALLDGEKLPAALLEIRGNPKSSGTRR